MGDLYLTGLASWLQAAGLTVVEYDGWTTRARSSGGYEPGRPWAILWHHTASDTTPQNDADYMCVNSSDRPIANLLVARDGAVWVLAGGATNTNGKGRSRQFSKGTVPADSMNTYAVGMEIANNGVGEPYPAVQIDAAFTASITVARNVGLTARDVCTHQDYAPDRKIDPATAEAVLGVWKPWASTSSGSWSVTDLRDEHERRWAGPTPGDDMPDEATFKQWMRDVLNEATATGQLDWPGTVRTQLSTAQDTYNQVLVVQQQIEASFERPSRPP